MNDQRRRTLLKAAVASVALPVAGCSEDSDSGSPTNGDSGDGADNQTENADGEDGGETNSGDDEDSGREQDDGRKSVVVGNQPYTRWLPAPETAADSSVEQLAFVYVDGAELRSLEDSLSDAAAEQVPREDALRLIQRGSVDEYIRLQTPIREPDVEYATQTDIYTGSFDRTAILDAYRNYEDTEWDDESEYGEFTFLTTSRTDQRPGLSVGVSESTVLYVPHTIDDEETQIIEQFADAGAGDIQRVHEADSQIARLFSEVDGSTFVSFTYGSEFVTGGPDREPPEGLLGAVGGTTVGESKTERKSVFPFADKQTAAAARDEETFPEEGYRSDGDISESVDGTIYTLTETLPTEEVERFRGGY